MIAHKINNMVLKRKQNIFFELPNEIIMHVIGFLSFDDLFNIINVGHERLKECSICAMKKKPFRKYFDLNRIIEESQNI